MGDFYQNGIITTLHNLSDRPVEVLDGELLEFSKQRPLGLILPSLFSELETEALPAIVQELVKVKVTAVNTMNMHGKARRQRTHQAGKSPDWKKAVVTLKEGDKIVLT